MRGCELPSSHTSIDRLNHSAPRAPFMSATSFVLTLSCINRPGIVAAVSTRIFESGGDILDAQQFDDTDTGRFFARVVFNVASGQKNLDALTKDLQPVAAMFSMNWAL